MALPLLFWLSTLAGAQGDDLALKSHHAKELMAAGRFSEAVPVYEELVRAVPGNPGLILNLGLAERMAGQFRKSIPHFEAVLKGDPGNLPACLSLGAVHLELGEPGLAIAPLERVVAADAGNADARGLLAQALLAAGRPKEAALHFRKLTGLTPNDAKAWYGLGKSYESVSTNAFEQLRKTAPESCWMLALLADSRVTRKQYRSAFYLYRQALERNPGDGRCPHIHRRGIPPDGPSGLGSGRTRQGAPETSRSERAVSQNSKEYNQLALEAFSRTSRRCQNRSDYHQLRAETMSAQGQHLDAAKEWRAALAMQPGNPTFEKEARRVALSWVETTSPRPRYFSGSGPSPRT